MDDVDGVTEGYTYSLFFAHNVSRSTVKTRRIHGEKSAGLSVVLALLLYHTSQVSIVRDNCAFPTSICETRCVRARFRSEMSEVTFMRSMCGVVPRWM